MLSRTRLRKIGILREETGFGAAVTGSRLARNSCIIRGSGFFFRCAHRPSDTRLRPAANWTQLYAPYILASLPAIKPSGPEKNADEKAHRPHLPGHTLGLGSMSNVCACKPHNRQKIRREIKGSTKRRLGIKTAQCGELCESSSFLREPATSGQRGIKGREA